MGKKLVRLPPVPPVCPEQQRRLHMMLEKAQVNAKVVDLNRAAPPSMSPEEYRRLAARFRRPGPPTPVAFIPGTVVDLSAHTCATRGEADIYKDLANAPDDAVFMILDPATGIADDEFKASIIKRYRDQVPFLKPHRDSTETVVAQSGIPDQLLGASVLKRHRQDESVDTASGIPDGVLGAPELKRHCEEPSVSSETVVADLSSPTTGRLAARFRRPGPPTPVAFTPITVVDLSAHTCATRGEAHIYKKLANAPDDAVFMILDPATGIADDEFKASIIKRYRGIPDEVLGGSGLKRHRQDESVDTNN